MEMEKTRNKPIAKKKNEIRLNARISAYDRMCKESHTGGKEYVKPGSNKK